MYFSNYGLRKTPLDKYLKSAALQYLLASNMINAPEHCSSLEHGNFTIFIDYWEGNKV